MSVFNYEIELEHNYNDVLKMVKEFPTNPKQIQKEYERLYESLPRKREHAIILTCMFILSALKKNDIQISVFGLITGHSNG